MCRRRGPERRGVNSAPSQLLLISQMKVSRCAIRRGALISFSSPDAATGGGQGLRRLRAAGCSKIVAIERSIIVSISGAERDFVVADQHAAQDCAPIKPGRIKYCALAGCALFRVNMAHPRQLPNFRRIDFRFGRQYDI